MTPIRRPRNPKTSEIIARELANEIIRRDLPSGTALASERDMVERYGVGRTTLREALRLLETRGVLTIRVGPGGGPIVRRPMATDLSEALTLILQFEGASLWDVFQVHRALQPMVVRLAAPKITARGITEIAEAIARMQSNLGDDDVFGAEMDRIYAVINTAAGSVTLRVLVEAVRLISHSTLADVSYPAEQQLTISRMLERVLDALRRRDAEGAERAMRSGLDRMGRYWTRHFGELVHRPVRWTSA
jgi:DNA-binding FadR family transcriptional regulator